MRKKFLSIILLLSTILSGCNKESNPPYANQSHSPEFTKSVPEQTLEKMSLHEKISQLFILQPEALKLSTQDSISSTNFSDNTAEFLKKYPIGGIIFFKKNIQSKDQLTSFTAALQSNSKLPLFMSIDEEGGIVARIANTDNFDEPKFASMESIGNTGDTSNAYKAGATIGQYLQKYGFNLNFAPVADINTNPQNRVIGNRSFGSTPDLVSSMVSAAIDGFHSKNIMCCTKHFPGHGDTSQDTHDDYVAINKTWDELLSCELIPFINSLNSTDMLMIAHITMPNITSDNLPASLSPKIINDKLRNELFYNGIVITDSLSMGAIVKHYTSAQCAVNAILAGVDILLMPKDFIESYNAIYEAVKDKIISEDQINNSVLKILALKEKYNLLKK